MIISRRFLLVTKLIAALVIYQPSSAGAEASAGEFLRLLRSESDARMLAQVRIGGIAQGLFWSNMYLRHQGRPAHYCAPERMAMTDEQVIHILRRHVQANPQTGNFPLGIALMESLKETFPCPS